MNEENNTTFLEKYPWINNVIGIALLMIIGTVGWFSIRLLLHFAGIGIAKLAEITSHLDAVVIVALITGSVSIIGVFISSVIAKIIDYRKSRQDYLAKKREKSYEAFIEMFYKLIDATNNHSKYTIDEMVKDMMSFSQELTLWGSKKVVKKWVSYKNNISQYDRPKENLAALEVIMNEMRKDMGTGKVKKSDLLKLFIKDLD